MPKKIPPHLRDKARKCLFCGEPGLTGTHVYPDWLNRLIKGSGQRVHTYEEHGDPYRPEPLVRKFKRKQGSVFSQAPYLACGDCNNGWMNRFEDEMVKFAKPIFLGEPVSLTRYQTRVMVGWLTLITILVQYIERGTRQVPAVPAAERYYFKKHRWPPDNWTIVAASLDAPRWRLSHRINLRALYPSPGFEWPTTIPVTGETNTHLSSFGMGKLFVQLFACPIANHVHDYRTSSKAAGLQRLWPLPSGLWFPSRRLPKFPTKLILDDDGADRIADEFHQRLGILTLRR